MRLTAYTDYALRVLKRLTTIADIAKGYDVSENHLMKVVHQLGVAGIIDTVRGRNGGLRLHKPPAAAQTLRLVPRRTEARMSQVHDPEAIVREAEAQRLRRAKLPAVLDYAFRPMLLTRRSTS